MPPDGAPRVRRIYDEPSDQDGVRVLVDRIWPRGMTKERARLDEWLKEVAPSTELRRWYAHEPNRFDEFERRYRVELTEDERPQAVAHLSQLAATGSLTLLTATKRPEFSEATVLAGVIGTTS